MGPKTYRGAHHRLDFVRRSRAKRHAFPEFLPFLVCENLSPESTYTPFFTHTDSADWESAHHRFQPLPSPATAPQPCHRSPALPRVGMEPKGSDDCFCGHHGCAAEHQNACTPPKAQPPNVQSHDAHAQTQLFASSPLIPHQPPTCGYT